MLPETRFLVSIVKGKQGFLNRLKRDCVVHLTGSRVCVCVGMCVYAGTYGSVCAGVNVLIGTFLQRVYDLLITAA